MFDWYVWLPAVVLAYFFLVPLGIGLQQRFAARPAVEPLDLKALPPNIAGFLMSETEKVLALGFDEPTLLQLPNPVPHVRSYLVMLVNRRAGDKAMITAVVGDAGLAHLETLYVEYNTRFDHGAVYNTLNSKDVGAFPPGPRTVITRTPTVRDPAQLYAIHQFVMHKDSPGGKKDLYEPGHAIEYLRDFAIRQSYDEMVDRGWLRYNENRDCYQPTLKGAYLICWGVMQPMRYWRQLRMKRDERRIQEEFTQWSKTGIGA